MSESPDLTKLSCGCLMEVTDRPGELRIHMHTQCEAHAIQLHGATPTPLSFGFELPPAPLEPVRVPPAFASLVYSCGRPARKAPR